PQKTSRQLQIRFSSSLPRISSGSIFLRLLGLWFLVYGSCSVVMLAFVEGLRIPNLSTAHLLGLPCSLLQVWALAWYSLLSASRFRTLLHRRPARPVLLRHPETQ